MTASPELPSPRAAKALRRDLCAWFARERRDLPWRRDRDPYRVWISEAMLQQTRVETVIPYYERFLERLPNLAALAAASEEDVVALWSGLGYYRRARALREAAQVIVREHEGRFPRALPEALALPGVGPYTAGAVLSIAYGESQPLVDGNVARVFSRLFMLEEPLGSGSMKRALDRLSARLVPKPDAAEDAGDWNQALMELGATICTPRAPRCLVCPVAKHCRGRRETDVETLPRRKIERAKLDVQLEMLWIEREDEILLVQRPGEGRMAGMWELPTVELGGETRLWPAQHDERLRKAKLRRGSALAELPHAITHHRIRAGLRRASVSGSVGEDRGLRWAPRAELSELALTGLTKKAWRRVQALA